MAPGIPNNVDDDAIAGLTWSGAGTTRRLFSPLRALLRVRVLAIVAPMLAVAIVLALSVRADAADHPVNSESDLRTAIASAADGDTITFNVDVTLTQDLPAIQANVTILGSNRILDGASRFRGFFVAKFSVLIHAPVTVTIQDLTIRNARARGGAGKDNAGGGAGLGGALFVANLATVTVRNVQFDTNSALGGLGGVDGIFGGGGGGGLGGFGGGSKGAGGGGAGAGASGGTGGLGVDGSGGIILGAVSGGDGGGGAQAGHGGGAGGGGGGAIATPSAETIAGGGGGGVGGGAGTSAGSGGNGAFGGGGGGSGETSSNGGMGGYGGGGGASGIPGGTLTGLGGFGGGGAGGASGGFGGGAGAVSIGFPGGGGGAGLGGALFVQEGGSLTLAGPLTINGGTVSGGAVFDSGATRGSAYGSGIFLQGGGTPLTCAPGASETQTIADDIADQAGSGGDRSRGLTKGGAGTLTLAGVNTYSGATTVTAGTLLVDGSIASPVTVNSGGTLGGAGTISNTVTVNSGGTLSPGSSTAILNTGALTLTAGSTLTIEINGTTVGTQYDRVNVTGGVTLGNATLNMVLGFTPSAGQTFTIIANDLSDAVGGIFSGLPEGSIFTVGAGRFRISYVGGTGNDVTLTAIVPPTIAKAFGTLAVLVNGTTTLTFTLADPNAGTALTGVGFTDPLPAGLVVATPNGLVNTCGGSVTAVAGSGSVALVNGGLAAGGSCTITANVTGLAGGLKSNITSAVTSAEGGPGGTAVAFLVVVAPPAVAPPTIAKAFGAASISLNGTTTLTFTLTNPNAAAALNGVGFTDTLPAGLVVATPNGLANACGGTATAVAGTGSVVLVNGALPASGSCTIAVNVTGTTGGVKVNTTGALTSTEGGPGGTASASLAVIAPPTIAKAFGAASISLNGTTTLTFTLTNPNAGTALNGVGFTDTLPAGLVVATPNALANVCGGTVSAVAGTGSVALVNGALPASGSCTIKVNVTGTTAGAKNNTTSSITSTEGGTGGTASASLEVIAPPTIAKAFVPLAILVNGTTTLTFTLSNPNAGTALTGVGFTDTLAAGLVVANPNGLANTCGGTVTADPGIGTGSVALVDGALPASSACTITVNVTGLAGGLKGNTTGAVTSAEGGTGGTAVAFLVVVAPPAVAPPTIAKAFGAASIVVNGTTTLTFTLGNPNPGAALSGVGFTDPLPTGLVVATPNGLTNTCGGTVTAVAGTGSVALAAGGLAAGGSCVITVNVVGTTPGAKNNITSVVTSTEGGTGGTASASLAVIAPPTIAKAFGTLAIVVNGATTLTLTLTNPNVGTALSGVGFTDTLPASLVVATPNGLTSTCGGTVTAVAGSSSVSLTGTTLAAGGSCTITVSVTGTAGGLKANTTSVVTSTEGGTGGTAVAFLVVVAPPTPAPPTIAKAFGAASISVNGTTTLTFTLTNPKAATALTGVGFTDTLPAGLVVATPNGLVNTCGGTVTAVAGTGSVALVNGSVSASGSCTIGVNVTGTTAGAKNNTTSAVTSTQGGTGGTASASLVVIAPPTIAKAFGAASIGVNGTTTLTVTLTNPNSGTALTGVGFTDVLPAGLVVATPNGLTGSCGGGTITATAGATTVGLAGATLAAGTSCVFAINVKGVAAGSQVNTTGAVTSTNGGAGNAATASITVLAPSPPNLTIAKSHAGDFVKGQIGQYTITVSNIGQGPTAGAVTVTDTLPAGLTATSLSGAGWTCTLASLSCTRSDVLAAGASYPAITLIVSIAVTAPNVLTNTATVSGGGDTSPVDNTATDTISLSGAPIPTLSTFALAVFVIMVLLSGLRLLRRRPAAGR